jgi:signal transduction histidine kinase/methanogenic corrinoid protein MtbC1
MQATPLKILYVEDDRDLVVLVQERLAQAGFVVDAAYDGEEALAKYAGGSYDLLAIDQTLPVLDGLGVLRAMASRGPLPPTVMVTGTGSEKVAVQTMKLGADDYIVKDLAGGWLELLPSIVERVLRQRRLAEEKKAAEAELQEREWQLWHAQKHESLGILAGGIAHDFNNILAGIMGYADLALAELPAGEPVRAHLDVIKKSVRRAADLTRQMLAYSGKGKFIVEPVNLTRCVEDLSRMLEVSISKKAVLKPHLCADLPLIQADASQINQVIMNLIINASEAIGDQAGVISISTDAIQCKSEELEGFGFGQALPEGLYVRLEVADTGCGMDQQTLDKVFDPFFTTKFTGRGLGLAAVQGIVRGHKGAIRVASEPGRGTTFQMLFPASEPVAASTPSEPLSAGHWHGKGTVLVVDDEKLICNLAAAMIERLGFSVLKANDGQEAIELYRCYSRDIVCVLLDLTMPKMGGEETFQQLRQINPDVRVILSSGYNEEGATKRFSGVGLAGFIHKPYEFETMIARLQEAVGNARTVVTAISQEVRRDYLSALLAGQRHHCAEIVNQLISQRLPIRRLYVDLFQASLYEVGELWAANQISVATEHLATAVTEILLNQLSLGVTSRDRVGRVVVVAAVQPELHRVAGRIVADTFEMCGWDSFYLGANTAPVELAGKVGEARPHLVALSLAMYGNLSGLEKAIDELRRDVSTLPIIVGGRGFLTGGTEIVKRYSGVSYIASLDELDVYIRDFRPAEAP